VASVSGPPATNVDVHVTHAGDVLVGVAVPDGTGDSGVVALARLRSVDIRFQYKFDGASAGVASFDVDRFGTAFYASYSRITPNLRSGQDFLAFGPLTSSEHPYAPNAATGASATLTVDRGGIPAISGLDEDGFRFVSRFSVPTGTWDTETLPIVPPSTVSPVSAINHQALAFDKAGNPAISFVNVVGGSPELVVARRGQFGWLVVAADAARYESGTSVASSPSGGIGFAYVNSMNELVFGSHEVSSSQQLVATAQPFLTPRSLAFDPDGNPAIVYSEAQAIDTFGPLHLARRDAQGQWVDEVLPLDASIASLTFDSVGNAYVAAVTVSGISLIAKSIPALLDGDYNGDDIVDAADYVVWRRLHGQTGTGLPADGTGPNGMPDDVVDELDYNFWSAHFGSMLSGSASPGDYNGDNVVDAADYVEWRRSLGQTGTGLAADGTGPSGMPDGVVDELDYNFWTEHFGNMPSGGASFGAGAGAQNVPAALVPEPSGLLLVVVGLLIVSPMFFGRW
jgi:hypothetical protein